MLIPGYAFGVNTNHHSLTETSESVPLNIVNLIIISRTALISPDLLTNKTLISLFLQLQKARALPDSLEALEEAGRGTRV